MFLSPLRPYQASLVPSLFAGKAELLALGWWKENHSILSETGPSTGLPGHSGVWCPTCLQNCSLCFAPQVYMFLVKWNDLSEKVVYRRFTEIYEFHVSPPGTHGLGVG